MDEMIKKIDDVVEKLLKYDHIAYMNAARELINDMIAFFPTVISYYADPRMSNHIEEAGYWPKQLERIIAAVNEGDDLSTADILYNETRANLMELQSILCEKGIL